MGNEIEAKIRVDDHEAIRQALAAAGAEPLGALLQTDEFFDTAQDRFRTEGAALRLRSQEVLVDGAKTGDARPIVTFKGKLQSSRMKVRQEIETRVDSAETGRALILACGLHPVRTIQKRRHSHRLDGCLVELDEVPILGTFVEVEGPSEDAVDAVCLKLGLTGEHIATAYVDLLSEAFTAAGLDPTRLTFDAVP